MKRRTLMFSALIALGVAGSAVAGELHARWMARQTAQPSAQSLHLDTRQTQTFNDLQARQRAFRQAAYAAIGDLLVDAHSELASNAGDLPALSAEVDRTLVALVAEQHSLKSQRMAFYQSLDSEQQAAVQQALLQRVERLQRLHAAVGDFLQTQP